MKKTILLSFLALGVSLTAAAQTKGQDETTDVNQYGQVVSSKPVNAALQDGILVFQNKTENYKMWFDVRIQGDAAVYFGQDENLVKIGNGMSLRRTRFAIKASSTRTGTENLTPTGPAEHLNSRTQSLPTPDSLISKSRPATSRRTSRCSATPPPAISSLWRGLW